MTRRTRHAMRCSGGWIMAEALVALAILGIIMGGLALSQNTFRKFNTLQLARLRCIAAGEGQLDSIAATGKPIAQEKFRQLWDDVRATVEQTPGRGEWAGLTLVKVTAVSKTGGRETKIELARYLKSKGEGKR